MKKEMNQQRREILDLIKSCILGERAQVSDDFDWENAYNLGKSHQILPMLYYGAYNSQISIPEAIKEKLNLVAIHSIRKDQNQLREIAKVKKLFVQNNIAFLPLKGMLLKYLYPQTDIRSMGDADILIRMDQFDAIRPLMEEMGYREIVESDHEWIWDKSGILHLELHKRLIPSYNRDYYAYFGDGWERAHKTETSEYVMRDEDQLVYLFAHYAKHYRDAGIGIRHLLDIYVYLRAKPNMDNAYIQKELQALHLADFYENTLQTIRVWFDGQEDSPMTDFITEWIFESGSYGTKDRQVLSEGLKISKTVDQSQVKHTKVIRTIFPSAKTLSQKHRILCKLPILLPFFWVYRWITTILLRPGAIKRKQEDINMLSTETISTYQKQLNYVGLDFNFK